MKKAFKRYLCIILSAAVLFTLVPYTEPAAEEISFTDEDSLFFEDTEVPGGETEEAGSEEDGTTDITPEQQDGEEIWDEDPQAEEEINSPEADPSDPGETDPDEPLEGQEPEGSGEDPEEEQDEEFMILESEEEELYPAEGEESELSGILPESVKLETVSYNYKGKRIKPVPIVTVTENDQEVTLKADEDYTVSYKNNLNVGTASVIVTGIGKYSGTVTAQFKIKPVSIKDVAIKSKSKVYTGKPITQTSTTVVTAKVNGKEKILTLDTDYTVTYEKNKSVGTASLIVTGCGNYKGSITKEFSIIPTAPAIRSAYAGTKKLTVKWDLHEKQTTGFMLQYSTVQDFSSGRKNVMIRSSQTVSAIVKGLKVGQTYYVRLRAYKNIGEKRYYSKWSNTRTVKLKSNSLSVSGSGAYRNVILNNPKSSVTNPRVAVWSQTKGQDDLTWYTMKKHSDGSWRVQISLANLGNYGACQAHCYDGDTFIREKAFSVPESDFLKTRNTISITGSGVMRKIKLLHPAQDYKNVRAAVWSEKNGQDDLAWVKLSKKSNGSWSSSSNLTNILHSGKVHVHVYAGTATLLGTATFTVKFGMEPCSSEEEYIEKIAPAVQRVCKKYGYLPSVLIAQSCLENGYGIPSYWDNPEISGLIYYNNMVGLKSELLSASWQDYTVWGGKSITKKTPEVYDGHAVIITDSFRVYSSIEQSFADYLLFMTYASNYGPGGKPKYGPEVTSIKNPSKLIKEVAKRGYATGSTYPTSVIRIINNHDLTKYDDLSKVKPTSYGP